MSDISLKTEVIRNYANKIGINLEEAKKRLETNYKKEVESVDAKEIALKSIKAIRLMSPQLAGVVQREKDVIMKVRSLEGEVKGLRIQVDVFSKHIISLQDQNVTILKQLELQKNTFKKTITLLEEEINKSKESLFSCYWKKLKSYLLKD